MRILLRAARCAVTGVVLTCAAGALAASVAARADLLRASRVLTGSMSPAIRPGALVVSCRVAPHDVRPGMVVVFVPPAPFAEPGSTPVAHRVVAVAHVDGDVVVRSKGDANAAEDPWALDVTRSSVYRVCWTSSSAGRVADLVSRGARVLLVVTVTVASAGRLLVVTWRTPRRRRTRRDTRVSVSR